MYPRCQVCQGCKCNLGLEDVHTGYCECRNCGGCSCNLQDTTVNRTMLSYCRCTTYQGCMCVNLYGVLPAHEVRDPVGDDYREDGYLNQENPNYYQGEQDGQERLPPPPPENWLHGQASTNGQNSYYQENANYYQEEQDGQEPLPTPPPGQWFQAPTNGQDTFYPQSQEGSQAYQAGTRGRDQGRLALSPPPVDNRERQSNPSNNVPSNNPSEPYICEQCNGCLCNRFPYIKNSNYCSCESRGDCWCDQGLPTPQPTYYQCPECHFPSDLCPPIQDQEVVVPLTPPKFDCVWYFYCTRCNFPRNQVPAWVKAQQREMPLPERMLNQTAPPRQENWGQGSRVTPSGRPPMLTLEERQARQSRTWGGTPQTSRWNGSAHAQPEAQNPTSQQAPQANYSAGYGQHQGAPHSYREGAYRPGNQVSQDPPPSRVSQPPRVNPTNAATSQQQQTPQRNSQANRPKPDSPYRSIG